MTNNEAFLSTTAFKNFIESLLEYFEERNEDYTPEADIEAIALEFLIDGCYCDGPLNYGDAPAYCFLCSNIGQAYDDAVTAYWK